MPVYPFVVKQFKVWSETAFLIGAADIVLPKIIFEKDTVKGAGLGGSMNMGVAGNVQPMETTLTFHTNTVQSLELFTGEGQKIRCTSSIMNVDSSSGKFKELPEEIVMMVFNNQYDPGKRDPSTKGAISLMLDVTYLSLTFNGRKYWEIDPFNDVRIVNGRDINAQTRANVG